MLCSSGVTYGPVGGAPKCCSSLTAMDTLLGMMQGYKDEMKTLKAQMAQVQSGGQQNGMATYAEQYCVLFKSFSDPKKTIENIDISISEIEISLFKK